MKRSRSRLVSIVVFTAMLVCTSTLAYAQGGAASTTLAGSVIDTSGGVVPGADIVAKSNQTATEYRAVSDTTGHFMIAAISPGTYTVTITLSGFKTVVLPDVTVNPGIPASVKPVTLEVGKLEETVTVTGATEIVQTQTAAVTTTLTTRQIGSTPLPTRNTLDFVTSLPGVNVTSTLRNSSVMGLPGSALNITIDGLNTQDNTLKSSSGSSFFSMINPRLDAVEEVSVSMAGVSADSSGQGSVQIRFQTRSGTNRLTGSVYHYMRRTRWNTNYWFNQHQTFTPRDKSDLNTFGGRVGGPIIRDKVFYFLNYEEFRQPASVTRTRTVLTPASLAGNFVYSGGSVPLLNLAAANNQISTPDPTVMQVLNSINATLPNGSVTPGSNLQTNSFSFQNNVTGRRIYPTVRVDVNVTKNNRVGVSAYVQDYISKPDILNGADPIFPGFPMAGNQLSWRPAVMANWRTMLGANLVNEARFGRMGWTPVHFFDNITANDFPGGRRLSLGLVTSPYCCSSWEQRAAPSMNIEDSLSWIKGKHTLTFGGAYTRISYWQTDQYYVPSVSIGFDTSTPDPANAMFNTTNFPGANSTDLSNARSLYALLTGRLTSLPGTAYLAPDGTYQFLGPQMSSVIQNEWGFYGQDSWKVKPNITVNAGMRWEVQLPFYSTIHTYTRLSDYNMLFGISGTNPNGTPNYFPTPGSQYGSSTVTLTELTPNAPPFNTDWNNLAPSAGIAWRPSMKASSWLEKLLSSDPVFRAGYSRAYTREGMSNVSGIFGANPGGYVTASRNLTLGNLYNDGLSAPLLLSQTSRLTPPAFQSAPAYPLTPGFTDSINAFYPNTQTPWVHSFNFSFQRAITKDTAVDIRYVGTRARGGWVDGGYQINQLNIANNGWITEFQHAQANYQINEQNSGWGTTQGNSFAYRGLAGQYPLPIFQAFFSGIASNATNNTNTGLYTSSQYANATQLARLVPTNPDPGGMANQFFTTGSYRANGLAAGYPSNFFYMNPVTNGGVWVTGRPEDGLQTNYDAVQVELRRRMSGGLLVQGSYQYIVRQTRTRNLSLLMAGQDWYNQTAPIHTVKVNWVYELPFGQGKWVGSGVSRNVNRLIGGWSIDGLARIQSGNTLDFGNVRLVGFTDADLQAMYQLRFAPDATNPAITRVFMLPQDVIDNTMRAYATSYSSSTGYAGTPPSGRYFAPIQSSGCLETYSGSCGNAIHHYVHGPAFLRIDMSVGKRVDITSRIYGELRFEAMNVLNNIDFFGTTSVGGTSSVTQYQVGSAYRDSSNTQDPGGRLLQITWRISW